MIYSICIDSRDTSSPRRELAEAKLSLIVAGSQQGARMADTADAKDPLLLS